MWPLLLSVILSEIFVKTPSYPNSAGDLEQFRRDILDRADPTGVRGTTGIDYVNRIINRNR